MTTTPCRIPLSILTALLALALTHDVDAAFQRPRVGVIPLSHTGKGAARVARRTTASMAKHLRRTRQVRVVVLAQRRASRLHQCLQVHHCIQSVSRKLGVRYLVAGHVTRMGKKSYRVDLRVVRSDGEVMSADAFRTRSGKGRFSGRLALRLVRKANRVRLASASTRATDVPLQGAALFSRSDAASAAYTPEASDVEDPLTPAESKPAEPETAAVAEATEAVPSAIAEPTVQAETSFGTSIFSKRYTHAWTTLGAGVAALGAGIGFGVISRNANQAAQDADYQKKALLNHDKAKKNALVANILFGAGGAVVLSSAVMFLLEHRQEKREKRNDHDLSLQLQVAQKGGGLTVAGSF